MKISFNWLKDYTNVDLSPKELADKLTMVGLEAGDLKIVGENWDNVYTGQVLRIDKHPNADRLCLATVDLGGEQHTVVCGAPNIEPGQKIAFAKLGATLFNPYEGKVQKLKPAKIRGVKSEGMVCSEVELGISDNHEGILVLAANTPVGIPLADCIGDAIFDISVTPNRPDCLNVIGIAREAAAITGSPLHLPDVAYPETETATSSMIDIEIDDPDLCPRYCGGIIQDVQIGPSPQWMQERLTAAGMRPINNIVDITNFVMLEYGQPLHAFDYEKIGGQKIGVRRARSGERMTTLDGEDRELNPEMLLICDAHHPVAIAGVMGGEESEIGDQTRTILLESANFNNVSIRRTSRKLGLISEASSRFDKGLSRELPMAGIRRAIQLMVEVAGGRATRGIVDAYPEPKEIPPIRLEASRVRQVIGIDFGLDRIRAALESLGFQCESQGDSAIRVIVPYWRTDVTIVEDLIEEAARIIGYDEIPITLLSAEIPHHEPDPQARVQDQLRQILVGCGMQEIITYSLTSYDLLARIKCHQQFGNPIRMANPMNRGQEYLRTSLRAGMLTTFAANERHQQRGIMLFETGKVYLPREGRLPDEPVILCGILGGPEFRPSWFGEANLLDFFHAKGILEVLFRQLGIEARFEPASDDLMLAGKTAAININGNPVGVIGELHPEITDAFDIACAQVCLFELKIADLVVAVEEGRPFQPLPRFPSTDRDLALVVDASIPAHQICDIIASFPQVRDITLFDVYTGKPIPEGKKSLAFALRYQSSERTLRDEEAENIQQKILTELEREVGATLRS